MCLGGDAEDEVPTQMLPREEEVQVPQVMYGLQEAKVPQET